MSEDTNEKNSIKYWAEDDRPREKLISKGKSALSDAELLAILLNSGSRNESAVELARRILKENNNSLVQMSKISLKDLMKFKGVGEAKAVTIAAALELGRRRREEEPDKKVAIKASKDIYAFISPRLADLQHEEFWVLYLNRANLILKTECISSGGISGTVADPRMIFKRAIEELASAMILCHNHPSGKLQPSNEDIHLTRKLKEAGKLLDIVVMDHLIITDAGYFSFADEGMM